MRETRGPTPGRFASTCSGIAQAHTVGYFDAWDASVFVVGCGDAATASTHAAYRVAWGLPGSEGYRAGWDTAVRDTMPCPAWGTDLVVLQHLRHLLRGLLRAVLPHEYVHLRASPHASIAHAPQAPPAARRPSRRARSIANACMRQACDEHATSMRRHARRHHRRDRQCERSA